MLRRNQMTLQTLARHMTVIARGYASAKKSKNNTKATLTGSVAEDVPLDEPINPGYLVRTLGSSYNKWGGILEKHPELLSVKRKDIANVAESLKSLNYGIDDILSKPMILYYNSLTIENRYSVLNECGFQLITISLLSKYVTVMNKTVTLLKSYGHIPFALDELEKLKSCFDDLDLHIPAVSDCNENMELKTLRQQILNCYLRQRLDMTTADIEKLWKVYSRVRHKSFKSVQAMIQLLIDDLNFPKERIIKNGYLLYGDVENVRRIINEISTIDGQDIREIVYRRPKILMSSCDSLLQTLEHIKSFGIGEDAIIRCLELLTLGPDTVLERLRDLNAIEEFKVLCSNPRVLRLVHYQNKARLRLEYLNQLKVRCASLHILSCGSEAFAKFARDGSDRTKGRDIVVFLANIMKRDENAIRNMLTRHPNWCHIPVTHVKQCYEFLLSKKFPVEDIYHNLHLLLYPIKRIDEKLMLLKMPEFLEDMQIGIKNMHELSNNEILTLILYLIECEFHFTGDGIWTEQHTQHVENFNNLLPDFPESLNKIYKYGVKPTNTNSTEKVVMQNR